MKNNVHMKMGEILIANSACTLEPFYGFLFAIDTMDIIVDATLSCREIW